jgi:hypothetical protein
LLPAAEVSLDQQGPSAPAAWLPVGQPQLLQLVLVLLLVTPGLLLLLVMMAALLILC